MYEIDKKTPTPPAQKGRYPKYPFAEMKVGDSILIKGEKYNDMPILAARRSAYFYAERHEGYKFQTNLTDAGLRIWRISTTPEQENE